MSDLILKRGKNRDTGKALEALTSPTEPTKRVQIDIPESLHKRFKVACSLADTTMSAVMIDGVLKWMENNEPKNWQK